MFQVAISFVFLIVLAGCADVPLKTSTSPNGQISITLSDSPSLFGDDFHVTVTRNGRQKNLVTAKNDNCGPPRNAEVLWTPDSKTAAVFLCEGLCGGQQAWLYDVDSDRLPPWEEVKLRLPVLVAAKDLVSSKQGADWTAQHAINWFCDQTQRR